MAFSFITVVTPGRGPAVQPHCCRTRRRGAGEWLPVGHRVAVGIVTTRASSTPLTARIGGITEFLRVAGLARAHGKDLSAHCAPQLHVAAMAAIPNARHIEWFHDHIRIESML